MAKKETKNQQLSIFWRPEETRPAWIRMETPEKQPEPEAPLRTQEEVNNEIDMLRAATPCIKCGVRPVLYTSKHRSIQGYPYKYVGMKCPLCGYSCGGAGGEDMNTVKHWNFCNRPEWRKDR